MRIPRVYEPQPLSAGNLIELSDTSVQHLVRALRLRDGDSIRLFNGDGAEYVATLTGVDKRRASAQITEATHPAVESGLPIHVGQTLSRGERMDYAVQKATEMGVTQITPLTSERCEVRLKADREDKRLRHWQQVAISACEQSQRTRVPEILEVSSLEEWIRNVDAELKLVLHHHTAQPLQSMSAPASVALLIGPEGGLTEAEVDAALAAGFQPVAFGPRVMRTETAPITACAILQYLWGDLG
ncbi:16S rRNA (uracil(1498)-N(3))-methyltransferase [Marinobacterium sediminicola]|uniref:Ribosomal RNA small subunit methyltransferase E n=1 Tax=Marinobacterium sediminicola TaxID=518898 RepID=A0ABY1S1Q8_9GAMM|nr:16S rRNA (uracil(1498)-N(3))-methyltransferase [Marinobacterium sediminicola]ULG69374.1 16S rRNA (uracil(1498)-N(3))-methyltransferase [Marinobacterium sediminicola]SMR75521.1 16S rRNA m(3)U-1498 methyltransferase [Marinobacterium sediminicola]